METLGPPSLPQQRGWPAIASGAHTLILAPTGTGKTLSAFLWELNALIARGLEAPLANAVQILYISPLKALNNDIQRNLERPLAELRARFEAKGIVFPEIRVAVRTGDTPPSARARMLRKAPHILITTPESLNIMLTSLKGRGMFPGVRAVIVDEIHAVAGTKRGAHLAITLERLNALVDAVPQRIGLSATQRPLDEIARFLGGCEPPDASGEPRFRPVTIVDCGLVKKMELAIRSPVPDLADVGGTVWPKVHEVALQAIRGARTTLIFVNNRAQAEKIAAKVNALADEPLAQPYHGSLSRERRFDLEQRLKAGDLRALVATSSLELGIDIGSVDLVMQIQSPKRVSAGLQRIGRAGHSLELVSRGVFVPTFRDDLVEMIAIVGAMKDGDVEPTHVPQNPLDVLSQVLVAMASVDDWTSAGMFDLARRSYPYHRLTRNTFDEVMAMLSGKYPSDLAAELEPRLTWDRTTDRVSGSRATRMMSVISGGTIPDRGLYTVNLPDRTRLGELDEEFVHESRVGDVFQLGSATWRINLIEHDRVIVTPAPGAPARMPFWHGEYMTRSLALSRRLGALRREVAERSHDEALDAELAERFGCDEASARSLREYMAEQRAATGVVPDDRTLVVEHFRDEMGAIRIVIHSSFGGRVNAPWGMALAQRMRESLGAGRLDREADVQVQTTDDGIMLRLPDLGGSAPLRALFDLSPQEAEQRVLDEVGDTSLFGARFRMNAARALLLPRGNPRRRMPLWLQRLKAADLLQTVRQFPSFPILVETYREVLQDAFDLAGLREVLDDIQRGTIATRIVETERASPFASSLQFSFVIDWLYGDDTPRAERRAAMLSLDRAMLDEVMGKEGADDDTAAAMTELVAERRGTAAGRRARSADELAQLLDRAGDITMNELRERVSPPIEWTRGDPAAELLGALRAVAIPFDVAAGAASAREWRVILTESYPRYAAAMGAPSLARVLAGESLDERDASGVVPAAMLAPVVEQRVARREILARFLGVSGPVTVEEIRARYGWPTPWIEGRLDEWERAGKLVRGAFRRIGAIEWSTRRLVEIARRRALAKLRREIEPVSLATFAGFLLRWQHVDPRDRVANASGLEIVLRQLYGAPRPADGWERDYLPSRLGRYDPQWLAQLASSGRLVWAGGKRHGTTGASSGAMTLRFFERGDGALWLGGDDDAPPSDGASAVRDALARDGASFLADVQAATGLGTAAARDALRELVVASLATNDTVESLREVVRLRALHPQRTRDEPDPTRWLPENFSPSPNRPVMQRRPNLRRLPKWRRPDLPGPSSGWSGRWSLLRTPGTLGPVRPEQEIAERVARQWLERYGVVTRDWWRRERPPVSWRAVYQELKRLEYRGDVRRGYFVQGLGGAQFALPDAVERLRGAREEPGVAPFVVIATSDPANPYTLPLENIERDPLSRPRGSGAMLVLRGGAIAIAAEARGRRVLVAPTLSGEEVAGAARALGEYIAATQAGGFRKRRAIAVETIDGHPAGGSRHLPAFVEGGWRRVLEGVRYYEK
ncbi:MAG: DEAD/DEAH box helicase [Gemmatimonadaceae bacterium]